MFSRNRSTSEPTSGTPAAPPQGSTHPGGKGRPTPKRSEAEAARKRPLVPADRKVVARSQRAAAKEARDREFQAMQTGDERYLPARDKGPVRRWVRDLVDARRNLGEYFLPISIALVLATFLTQGNLQAGLVVIGILYTVVLVTVVDGFLLARRIKKGVTAKFGTVPRGVLMYGVLRAYQIRRSRLPRPQVTRGQFPS